MAGDHSTHEALAALLHQPHAALDGHLRGLILLDRAQNVRWLGGDGRLLRQAVARIWARLPHDAPTPPAQLTGQWLLTP